MIAVIEYRYHLLRVLMCERVQQVTQVYIDALEARMSIWWS